MQKQFYEICRLAVGLFTSGNLNQSCRLFLNRKFSENANFFKNLFEIGRRHKILNPEKMRSAYGKLMFMLQDAVVREGVSNFNVYKEIETVHTLLSQTGALDVLKDKDFMLATCVFHKSMNIPLSTFNDTREKARKTVYQKYSEKVTVENIKRVIDSITDNNSFLVGNRLPIDKMISFLDTFFNPRHETSKTSLKITSGVEGSCLSHDHAKQYSFVRQSLCLWRNIQDEMFKLWIMADSDLLSSDYHLTNTGQGFNRVQPAPSVTRAMANILKKVKSHCNELWVGLSVVHLGDRDVPNALFLIDKYTLVPKILNPIVTCLEQIDELANNNICKKLLEKFGGVEAAKVAILRDFFRHGFDGSGDDGGSCVDGRLTSCWNWCSTLEKKPYFPLFLISGFIGFDGHFKSL
ncbi:UPF0652 protein-like [Zophobas morio]|uniref:UPF0652 protein-like n=1 Tax=Zophobas morio TaxID=2755281 RepID=UPI0030835874